jgi:hypothetical protein
MFVAGVIALDCGLLRYAYYDADLSLGLASTGIILAADVLAWAAYRLLTFRASRGPFLIGFVANGLAAMLAFLAVAWLSPRWFTDAVLRGFKPAYDALAALLPRSARRIPWVEMAVEHTVVTVLCGLPLLSFAAFGGCVYWLAARNAPSHEEPSG